MAKISFPEELKGPREVSDETVVGPFAVIHNGEPGVGFFLESTNDGYIFEEGGRPWVIDSTYKSTVHGSTIMFYSKQWASKFVVRPLTQNDVKWILPTDPDMDIDDLKELLVDGATDYIADLT